MIVDFHTHIFWPDLIESRQAVIAHEPAFASIYTSPRAVLASYEGLIASMDAAGVDVSVALGFAWHNLDNCRRHNDYLLESARHSQGRVLAFCSLPLAQGELAVCEEARRCIAAGASGFGELRPDDLGYDLTNPELAATLASAAGGKPLLFHVSEPVGHSYAGKKGLALESYYSFLSGQPGAVAIGAHWGGGLPFYAQMPEVADVLSRSFVDTAASSLLYTEAVIAQGVEAIGAGRILFGSDFPLLSQKSSRRKIEDSGLGTDVLPLILGANAAKLLKLP